MSNRLLGLALLCAPLEFSAAQTHPAPTPAVIPIRRVILFSSGVGYFEHASIVRGDGSAELAFRTAQINDVLKSLVLQDQDGGRVTAVTYPSQDPLAKTLRSFQVDITANPSLPDLLNQLRGARVTVQAQAEQVTGTILGVEARRRPVDRGEPINIPVLNLVSGGSIREIELPSVTSLTLDDPALQDELTRALAAVAQARDQDRKPVTIDFAGVGDHRLRIGYVVEAPVWKISYRLMLGDHTTRLQGWAIVDNQTESDWNDVSLSLVSGRPISFAMDLYSPLYATRPTVSLDLGPGLRPQIYEAGIDDLSGKGVSGGLLHSAPARARQPLMLGEMAVAGTNGAVGDAVQAMGTTRDLGELFEYSLGSVTLPRQQSAMLPIITDTISATRVSIYNAAVQQRYPLTGVRLRNTSGKLLLQGPITVLNQNTYAGDARIDNVPAGQERLLSYGVDLETVVDDATNATNTQVQAARIVKGTLLIDNRVVASQEYRIQNKGRAEKLIVIEHPIRPGYKLTDTPAPVETTPTLYRFQTKAPAAAVTSFTVKEVAVLNERVALGDDTRYGTVLSYYHSGSIPPDVRDALGRAVALKQAFTELQGQVADRTARITQIAGEQVRIREDMKTVASTTQYYQRLLAKLNDQESAIERLQKERDDLATRLDAQRNALDDYISNLSVG